MTIGYDYELFNDHEYLRSIEQKTRNKPYRDGITTIDKEITYWLSQPQGLLEKKLLDALKTQRFILATCYWHDNLGEKLDHQKRGADYLWLTPEQQVLYDADFPAIKKKTDKERRIADALLLPTPTGEELSHRMAVRDRVVAQLQAAVPTEINPEVYSSAFSEVFVSRLKHMSERDRWFAIDEFIEDLRSEGEGALIDETAASGT
jgi:hypothetical protein